jgi:hypothetical protein
VFAPLAVSVTDVPAQIVDEEALTFTLGATFTVIVFDNVAVQPLELVPVQEYVVVAEGLTVIEEDVEPLLQR